MRARVVEERGFGLIELLFAMVMLNIGILALVGAFQSGALALSRSSATSGGVAVADKMMETYRGLKNCAIYLTESTIPQSGNTNYTTYSGDTTAFAPPGAAASGYYWTTKPAQWVTDLAGRTYPSPIGTPCSTFPSSTGGHAAMTPDPTSAVQNVTGPDGASYPVSSYIVVVQPSGAGWTGGYTKQVTVVVRNPRQPTKILARESSIFDPNLAP